MPRVHADPLVTPSHTQTPFPTHMSCVISFTTTSSARLLPALAPQQQKNANRKMKQIVLHTHRVFSSTCLLPYCFKRWATTMEVWSSFNARWCSTKMRALEHPRRLSLSGAHGTYQTKLTPHNVIPSTTPTSQEKHPFTVVTLFPSKRWWRQITQQDEQLHNISRQPALKRRTTNVVTYQTSILPKSGAAARVLLFRACR